MQNRPLAAVKNVQRLDRLDGASRRNEGWTVTDLIAALRSIQELNPIRRPDLRWEPLLAPTNAAGHPPRVVCIDDDIDFLAVLSRRLQQLGLEVATETSGVGGYRSILDAPPDLVITDYFMPNEYGTWLLRRLKEDASLRKVPVIVLTGRDIRAQFGSREEMTLEEALKRLGAATVLTKPLKEQSLARAVKCCLAMTDGPDRSPT